MPWLPCPGRTAARSAAVRNRVTYAVGELGPGPAAHHAASAARCAASGERAETLSQSQLLLDRGDLIILYAEIGRDHLGIVTDVPRRGFGDLHAVVHHHDLVGNFHAHPPV